MVVMGIDEVGRGSWAGPLVAGAVILKQPIKGLKDSKLLSRAERSRLALEIKKRSLYSSLGWVQPAEIDRWGLTAGLRLAMERALTNLTLDYDEIIIDGQLNFLKANPKARCLIKADQLVPCVSAASIIAKVARDNYMIGMAQLYPAYGFDRNVGYGTKLHRASLGQLGVT